MVTHGNPHQLRPHRHGDVEAIDYALYQAAFAPGGKFYGDTYTDPATLP